MNSEEHQEQCAVMKWWSMSCSRFGIDEHMLFAIPNGGKRDAITGKILKDEGVRAGIPDLFLAVPRMNGDPKHGLFIEMKKRKGGRVSQAQKEMIANLNDEGYAAVVCQGFQQAVLAIEMYLKGAMRI